MKAIIIGIDPGTTTAFCIMDFYGNIIKKDSSKRFNLKNLIRETTKAGNPVIIGCDKEKVPDFVEKFRRTFNAKIYCPEQDLTRKEKKDIVNKYRIKTKNEHERDACASALMAYEENLELIKKIISNVKKNNFEKEDELISEVIKKEMPIKKAINSINEKDMKNKKEKKEDIKTMLKIKKSKIRTMENQLKNKDKKISYLEGIVNKLNKIIKQLKNKNNSYKKIIKKQNKRINNPTELSDKNNTSLIKELKEKIKSKEKSIDENKNSIGLFYDFIEEINNKTKENKKIIILKKLKNLSDKEFKEKSYLKIKKDDLLLIENPNIMNKNIIYKLKDKIKIIIYKQKPSASENFIYINYKELNMWETDDFAFALKENIDEAMIKKGILKDIINEYKKERNKN